MSEKTRRPSRHIVCIERYGEINGRDAYAWRCSCGAAFAQRWASTSLAWVENDGEAHQRIARREETMESKP